MTDLPKARHVARSGEWTGAADRVLLDYEARLLRRRRLEGEGGLAILADLEERVSLEPGDALALVDGRFVEVGAAAEPLYLVTGDLARLAWHIGAWRVPCEFGGRGVTIRRDPVLKRTLEALGAEVAEAEGPFSPEGRSPAPEHARVQHHGYRHHLAEEEPEEGEEPRESEPLR
ncbi:MAG: urease accessory protein UreE [Paracoccaceae bacterium]|nr:urease accessory protein UreE [Paracoccaceae bacterium]